MDASVRLRLLFVAGLGVLGALAPAACADSETFVGEAPPATGAGTGGIFDPGDGPPPTSGSGSGTGAGSGSGTGGDGAASSSTGAGGSGGEPQECEDALKLCPHTFTHPAGPTSVELRGSFAPDGWTNGVPLVLAGGTWQVEVMLSWNVPVQYKFLLDGTTWVTDPGNPNQIDDGFGGKNSYLAGITCAEWTCAE